jgi:hypothetical protein
MATAADPGRRTPLMTRAGEAENELLRTGINAAKVLKEKFREALLARHPELSAPAPVLPVGPAIVNGQLTFAAPSVQQYAPPATGDDDQSGNGLVREPTCLITFEPTDGLTTMVGRIKVRATQADMAQILDPRAWSCTGGAIAASFIVQESDDGHYAPGDALNWIPVGASWNLKQGALLYEYARSDVASFENILAIRDFQVDDGVIRADYELHDCLICTFGALSAPGGLTVNQGYVVARRMADAEWWEVEVLKSVRVRDLTPHDPGNPYDFGTWVNSTIGGALGEWVHDARIMSPVF